MARCSSDYCDKFGFEGIVSKRQSSRYVSGPSRHWIKTKCPNWKRANVNRGKLFERPQKPGPTEEQEDADKETRGAWEGVGAAGIAAIKSWHGARAQERHVTILEREIADLSGRGIPSRLRINACVRRERKCGLF